MSEEELLQLQVKNNRLIKQLNALTNPIPRTPRPTQVKDVEIIHDPGKTVRFKLHQKDYRVPVWSRKKAKQQHKELKEKATTLIRQEWKATKLREKQKTRQKKTPSSVPNVVMDSAATSTVIHPKDNDHVIITNEKSPKMFCNANGTVSAAGMKAQLPFNLRAPANEAETVPSLAMNSLLSTSKLADANYITIFTKDEGKVFDAETARVNISGEAVVKGWRCPTTKLWRVPLKGNYQPQHRHNTIKHKSNRYHPEETRRNGSIGICQ
jgi:hypothetical protein